MLGQNFESSGRYHGFSVLTILLNTQVCFVRIARVLAWFTPSFLDYIIDLGFGRKEWKVQKLCLLDLPNELLDHISYLASLDQYRPGAIFLSATCKRMYYLGRPHLFEVNTFATLLIFLSLIIFRASRLTCNSLMTAALKLC